MEPNDKIIQQLIIPDDIEGMDQPAVDARRLHAFLEARKDFSTWIKDRIAKYGFVEEFDFVSYQNLDSPELGNQDSRAKHGGDRRTIEYALTIDMAKELSMVENNAKGKDIRRYFIAMEKRAKEAGSFQVADRTWALEARLKDAEPMVEFYEIVGNDDGLRDFNTTAKLLYDIDDPKGETKIRAELVSLGLCYLKGTKTVPYQRAIDKGFFRVILKIRGKNSVYEQPMVTGKGLQEIHARRTKSIRKVA